MKQLRYAVVRVASGSNSPENEIVSNHRTWVGADEALRRVIRDLGRQKTVSPIRHKYTLLDRLAEEVPDDGVIEYLS